MVPRSPRILFDAVSWHVRGVFATEANRRVGFWARNLWQPAEIEARRGLAQDLATELSPLLKLDRTSGYRVFAPEAVPPLDEICAIGSTVANRDGGALPGGKMFFRYRQATEDERMALLRIAVDRRLLAMVSAYFGILPVITEADYLCSFPTQGAWTKSQLWHCDDDAGDVLKVFIYCEDVTEADGPFELIESEASRGARAAVRYRYAGRRYRVSDEVMDAHVPRAQQLALLGPRGTIFGVDTVQCFHRGSRIVDPSRRRVAAMICYTPPSGRTLPRRLASRSAPLLGSAAAFTDPVARAALGAPVASKWV